MSHAFERAGFGNVRHEYLDGIDMVERRSMPLADRLAYGWRRYVVEGRRPAGSCLAAPGTRSEATCR